MKKFIRKFTSLFLTVGLAFTMAACNNSTEGGKDTPKEDDGLSIYASIYPMQEFTQKVVGDTAEVKNIMPPGSASHDFEPTTKQVTELSKADVLVYQGAGMESWIDSVKETLEASGSDIVFIEASEGIELLPNTHHHHDEEEEEHDHEHEEEAEEHDHEEEEHEHEHEEGEEHHHHHGAYDPHVWLSIRNSKTMVENIADALSEVNPDLADKYKENADAYTSELDKLDKEYTEKLADANVKSFVVTHEAFGYLAKDYGLKQYGLTGMGTAQDPNPEKMAQMVELVKKEDMKAIYYDNSGSPKVAEALAAELDGVEVLPLTTLHSPSEEELKDGANYVTMMQKNLENLLVNAQ